MNPDSPQLSEIEQELIIFFVNAAQAFGLPKSVGEIYGLYFASEQPLALDHVVEKLQISKGSASQGIRFLKSINALNPTYLPGDRRDHFTPELSLRRIADGFLRQRIRPEIKDSMARLREISRDQDSPSANKTIKERINTLSNWSKKADLIFPMVSKFLGSKSNKTDPTL